MLFSSFIFIFVFLPIVLIGWYTLKRFGLTETALSFLLVASLVFYAWWNPPYVLLLLGSTCINFMFQCTLAVKKSRLTKRYLLCLGVAFNLMLIGYFKYKIFFVENFDFIFGTCHNLEAVFLPLGISFFTFQQIACLVDTYKGSIGKLSLRDYTLFVSFFPQLIAGPIVKCEEIVPQFMSVSKKAFNSDMFCIGVAFFAFGLFKKIAIADSFSPVVAMLFDSVKIPAFGDAWVGSLAYTMQIYFDFSGYSDMAIGLGMMFGITLPDNFSSPYQSTSIIDFWRRWHITLSSFLRDYLYIPLGGNRHGNFRRYSNLMITMLLGGLWHGAGWTFIIWGGAHGIFLIVNNLFRSWGRIKLPKCMAWLMTFCCVNFAWIFFRAPNFAKAKIIAFAMLKCNTQKHVFNIISLQDKDLKILLSTLSVALLVSIFMPNLKKISNKINLASLPVALASGICFAYALWLMSNIERIQEFLYFQF